MPGVVSHLEMSLWSHGHDREVHRAQHLFCNGAEQQFGYLAAAPGAKNESFCVELAGGGDDLLGGVPFADNRVTGDLLCASGCSPGFEGLDCEVNCACRIVVRHPDGVGSHGCTGAKHVEEDDACIGLVR